MKQSQGTDSAMNAPSRLEPLRIGLAVLLGLLCVVFFALDSFGDSESPSSRSGSSDGEAVVLTEYELLSRAGTIEPQPYWVGRRSDTGDFELKRDPEGNLTVRYLTRGTTDDDSESLTVASYPLTGAYLNLFRAARSEGEPLVRHEGFVALAPKDDYSAFVVFGDQPELQVEVFSPRRGEAARLVRAGALTPLQRTPLS
jgi:hypothetical protein